MSAQLGAVGNPRRLTVDIDLRSTATSECVVVGEDIVEELKIGLKVPVAEAASACLTSPESLTCWATLSPKWYPLIPSPVLEAVARLLVATAAMFFCNRGLLPPTARAGLGTADVSCVPTLRRDSVELVMLFWVLSVRDRSRFGLGVCVRERMGAAGLAVFTAKGSFELDMDRRDSRLGCGGESGLTLGVTPAEAAPANDIPGRVCGS